MVVGLVGVGRQMLLYMLPLIRGRVGAAVVIPFVARRRHSAEFCARHNLVQCDSLERLVRDHRPTHLAIAVSRAHNGPLLLQALELGVPNIFVEKPPALDLAALEHAIGIAETRCATVVTGMNFRHAALMADGMRLAAENGGVAHADVEFLTSVIDCAADEQPARAAFLEFGLHAADLYFGMLGRTVGGPLAARPVGDGWLIGGGGGESGGSLKIGTYGGFFDTRISIVAANGLQISIRNFHTAEVMPGPDGPKPLFTAGKRREIYEYPARKNHLEKCGYHRLLENFLDGKEAPSLRDLLPTYREFARMVEVQPHRQGPSIP